MKLETDHGLTVRFPQSTFLNYFVGWLVSNGHVEGMREEDVLDRVIAVFATSSSVAAKTKGLDALVLPLLGDKVLLLMDMEGLKNGDTPALTLMLAAVTQMSVRLVFMQKDLGDEFRDSLGRLVGAVIAVVAEKGAAVRWPHIHVVLNQSRAPVDHHTLTASLLPRGSLSDKASEARVAVLSLSSMFTFAALRLFRR